MLPLNTKPEDTEPLSEARKSISQFHPAESPVPLLASAESTLEACPPNSVKVTSEIVVTDYIIRILRHKEDPILPGICIVDHIRNHTSISIPSIISYDLSSTNAIQSPYNLQLRLPGEVLYIAYPRLHFEQKYAFVPQYAEVLRSLQSVTSPVAGKLSLMKELRRKPMCRFSTLSINGEMTTLETGGRMFWEDKQRLECF